MKEDIILPALLQLLQFRQQLPQSLVRQIGQEALLHGVADQERSADAAELVFVCKIDEVVVLLPVSESWWPAVKGVFALATVQDGPSDWGSDGPGVDDGVHWVRWHV